MKHVYKLDETRKGMLGYSVVEGDGHADRIVAQTHDLEEARMLRASAELHELLTTGQVLSWADAWVRVAEERVTHNPGYGSPIVDTMRARLDRVKQLLGVE